MALLQDEAGYYSAACCILCHVHHASSDLDHIIAFVMLCHSLHPVSNSLVLGSRHRVGQRSMLCHHFHPRRNAFF